MNTGLVSIITPCYNCEKYINETIQTVLEQTYSNWEMIIIDDGSRDDSAEVIRRFTDSRIQYYYQDNAGPAAARNNGISRAKGQFIALLDADDLWEPNKLELQMKLMCEEVDIIYCSYDLIDEKGEKTQRPYIVPHSTDFRKMLTESVISCSTALIRKDILRDHPFKTGIYHEDYLLWMELLRIPCKAVGVERVLAHYRQVKQGKNKRKVNAAKQRWIIYRKHLHLKLITSVLSMLGYAFKGVRKYYL